MRLSETQLNKFRSEGFLLLPEYFMRDEVETICNEVPALLAKESEARVLESNRRAVRAVHGCHLENHVMRRLTLHPKLLKPAIQIVGSGVYVYQFKINAKAGFDGTAWPWHQDFKHWKEEDGLASPRMINVALYLEDVTSFNGPIMIIPGSHKSGNWCEVELEDSDWAARYRADVKYTMDKRSVVELVARNGVVSTEAPRGSVLFFDVNVAHGSASNISPFNRWIVIVSYNSIDNVPRSIRDPRAEFLVGRDHTELIPTPWDASC